MIIEKVSISEVDLWDKNPRNIRSADFERLKRQIKALGVYKPLICFKENGRYITLGGNMRLRALKELNYKKVEVSVVKADTEAKKIAYSLSDNDRAGQYEEDKLAELVYPHIEEIKMEDFRIDLADPISLKNLVESYGPEGVEFIDQSDRRTISIYCKTDEELIEMREILGISEQKTNAIDASILKDIIGKRK